MDDKEIRESIEEKSRERDDKVCEFVMILYEGFCSLNDRVKYLEKVRIAQLDEEIPALRAQIAESKIRE